MSGKAIRGVLHIHSVFSDGEESLTHIAQVFKKAGIHFMAVSDHAEVFDEERLERYAALCESLSSAEFLVIPGLELALKESIHILGYGITKRVRASSAGELVDGIHEAGGIAVLAHPLTACVNMIALKGLNLDGVEVWNARYDGTLAPRAESFQLLRRMQMANGTVGAYCGIDFHKMTHAQNPLFVHAETERLECRAIIEALRSGRFTVHGRSVAFPSSGKLTFLQELSIALKQPFCRNRTRGRITR